MINYRRFFLPFLPNINSGDSSGGLACPCCNSSVFRVSRRLQDMLVSLFVSIRRYRCISMRCSWEGNLREKKGYLPGRVLVDTNRGVNNIHDLKQINRISSLGKSSR